MPSMKEFNRCGEELERRMLLKTASVAVKMLVSEADVPEGAIRPKQDRGHIAQCQAFAYSRRDRETIAMLKEDNWCPAPVMAYGLEPKPDDPRMRAHMAYDNFEYGKYIGILTAPLSKAAFEPDVVIIYSDTGQLRRLLLAMRAEERPLVGGLYFPPSCAHSVVTPMLTGQYRVVIPDPGEYARALCGDDEIMFAVPGGKVQALVADLARAQDSDLPFARENMIMRPDFPQPEFYKTTFRGWGMDA
jgi:uncharacterized protein (DUF169 family)